jgi:hypothetical protein
VDFKLEVVPVPGSGRAHQEDERPKQTVNTVGSGVTTRFHRHCSASEASVNSPRVCARVQVWVVFLDYERLSTKIVWRTYAETTTFVI